MFKELTGIEVSNDIKNRIQEKKNTLSYVPKLVIVRVGEDAASISYEKSAVKKMEDFSLNVEVKVYSQNIEEDTLLDEIKKINEKVSVNGILILRPLPKHINEEKVFSFISKEKDVDAISNENLSALFKGDKSAFAPCTSEAVIELLKYYNIDIKSKNVVILGRSITVGKPLALLFLNEDATVTICHSKTKNIKEICKMADILVVAIGKAKFVDSDFIKKDAIVIDVGINLDYNNKLCGDVDFESVSKIASMLSPVPRGVGSITTAILAKHLLKI